MSRKRVKQYLMLLAVVGIVSIASGSGTFASFTAETVNPGNTFSTGTLLLHNTANGGTVCTSETGSNNVQTCDTLFSNMTITPGSPQVAYLTLTNAGTLPSSSIKFWEPSCTEGTPSIATLNGAVSNGASTSGSIAVTGLNQALSAGTPITVTDGTNTQVFHVSADTASGASSIPVSEASWTSAFANGVAIQVDTSAFTSAANLCGTLQFSITERSGANGSGSDVGCAWGALTGSTCDTTNGTYVLNYPGTSSASPSTLTLVSGQNGNTGTALSPSKSRYFELIVTPPASLGNAEQNDKITFDLHWQISA